MVKTTYEKHELFMPGTLSKNTDISKLREKIFKNIF